MAIGSFRIKNTEHQFKTQDTFTFNNWLNVYVDKVHGKRAPFETKMLFHGSVQFSDFHLYGINCFHDMAFTTYTDFDLSITIKLIANSTKQYRFICMVKKLMPFLKPSCNIWYRYHKGKQNCIICTSGFQMFCPNT